MIKTFWPGWSDHQLADGTVVVTTPTGHAYTTQPDSSLFFPALGHHHTRTTRHPGHPRADRTLMMPSRKRTRDQARADRIKAERALNDDYLAERNKPPPF